MYVSGSIAGRSGRSRLAAAAIIAFGSLLGVAPARADSPQLAPQTKIRLTIVQWAPTRGAYEKWDAIGGEYQVSEDGTLALPVIGTIPVGDLDTTALAARIAEGLKDKIGLVQTPEATISIVDYPPVYIVGDVKTPGEYKYHPGMTVLQTFAMSGGELRPEGTGASSRFSLVGELRAIDNSIMRGEIRTARLLAEIAGAKDFAYKPQDEQDKAAAETIYLQEKAIFAARNKLQERQTKSFLELRDLLDAEIKNLSSKSKGADADIASVEKDLRNVKAMVEKGIALPSRQGDLERMLRSYYAGRLDLSTAAMRVRQSISEASRNIAGLADGHQSEVTAQLQSEQASLDQLRLKRETMQRQLQDALSAGGEQEIAGSTTVLTYTVDRRSNGVNEQVPVSESSVLQPLDVLRVSRVSAKALAADAKDKTLRVAKDIQAKQTSQ